MPKKEPEIESDTQVKERARAQEGYEAALGRVLELKVMTDTEAWRKFYARIQSQIKRHGQDVLNAEKTREIIQHQEGVKILRAILDDVQAPVGELRMYVNEMPLFAKLFHTRAQWNEALGNVELKDVTP